MSGPSKLYRNMFMNLLRSQQSTSMIFKLQGKCLSRPALWAWPFANIFQVKGFLGPSCCEKQVSNDNI